MAKYKLELLLPVHAGLENLPEDKKTIFDAALNFLKALLINNQDVISVTDEGPFTMIIETTKDVDEMLTKFPADKARVTKLE